MEFQAVWVTPTGDGEFQFDAWPVGAGQGEVVTNMVAAFDGMLPNGAVDLMTLYTLAFPDVPHEALEQLLNSGQRNGAGLWSLWLRVAARLRNLPLWALETIELIYRDIGEMALARAIALFGEEVRIAGVNCGKWQDSFKAESGRIERRESLPEHADCSPLDIDEVASHILPGGSFARLMPGYETRSGQVEMLRAVTRAFNEGRHLLVEAGTGVGKSLAYLLPAASWALLNDLPVIISTNTRNLQTQLIDKDVPLVCRALRVTGQEPPLRVALMKGRSNYLCLRRMAILLEQSHFELERPELRHFADAVAWSLLTPDGDLDAFAGAGHADPLFLAKISSTAEECPGRQCRYWRRCFLQKARAKAMAAHVVIANHALVFAESHLPGTSLPMHAQIIFDEAHNLEEVATRHLSYALTQTRVGQLLRNLSRGRGRKASGILEVLRKHLEQGTITVDEDEAAQLRRKIRVIKSLLDETNSAAGTLFETLHKLVAPRNEPARFRRVPTITAESAPPAATLPLTADAEAAEREMVREVCHGKEFLPCGTWWSEEELHKCAGMLRSLLLLAVQNLRELGEMLRLASEGELALFGDQAANIDGAAVSLRAFVTDMDFVLAASDANHVYWAEPVSRSAGSVNLYAAPLSIGDALANLLYLKKRSVIFCSATLRVGSSFGFICRRLGVDKVEPERVLTCVAQSPFNYLTQCAALAPSFLPAPTGETGGAYVEQLSGLMLDVFTRTRGRALGLFTSYEMMNQVARLLEEPLREAGIRLLVQGVSGTRDQITRIFRAGGACTLLGAQSFWEGVDVVGEALSCVVMARLPFAAVQDPIIAARCEQIDRAGGSSFREFSLPTAVIRFRQGFGRLIRSSSDKGVVVVADPRVMSKNYGAVFRQSLPCPLRNTNSRAELLAQVEELFRTF